MTNNREALKDQILLLTKQIKEHELLLLKVELEEKRAEYPQPKTEIFIEQKYYAVMAYALNDVNKTNPIFHSDKNNGYMTVYCTKYTAELQLALLKSNSAALSDWKMSGKVVEVFFRESGGEK